ncbi:SDR family oxidoreductase [uncultured Jatrophihabitans sp.]|uniref:SDR family oxidoreductase n=1 Tax=uncultured Jatrophihabitans sp. TaxID=1610747 RepID=UPI0035CABFA2
MSFLLTGVTGSVGREVVGQLLQTGADVRASTRDPSTVSLPDGVAVRAVDLAQPSTLAAALDGVDAVYLFPSFDDPAGVARAVSESGVTRIVLLSSISTSLPDGEHHPNAARFLGLERALAATGITCTFLRAGEFAGNIRFYAPGIADDTVQVPFPDSLHLPIDERDIAEVAVIGLTTDRLAGQKPRLTGEQALTLRQEIEIIADAVGRQIQITELTEQQAVDGFIPQAPRAMVTTMISTWKTTIGQPPEPSPAMRTITGHAPGSFANWVRDHVDQFR